MIRPTLNKALAVGALVAATGAAFLLAFTFFRKGGYSESESYLVHARFRDATGLTWKSRVQIAGIQVGEVARITLEGDRARLELRIKNGVELRADACLIKSFPSALLPDAQLEVSPGSPGAPPLASLPVDRREITCVRESTSVQQLLDAMAKIAADVQVVTGDLAKTVGGPRGSMREIIENLAQLTRQLDATVAENAGQLTRLIANAEGISRDLREVTGSEKDRMKEIIQNVAVLTVQLRQALGSAQEILDGAGGAGRAEGGAPGAPGAPGGAGSAGAPGTAGASAEARGVRQAIEKANDNLKRLDDLLAKVQEGKSVAGRLLTDERMGQQLGNTVEAISGYVDSLERLQIVLRLRSEWLLNQTGSKTYFGGRIVPRPDQYYVFDVISDPRGVDTVSTSTITTRNPVTGKDSTSQVTTTLHQQSLTFSLELAKRYGPIAFRVGVIESSGGVGSDLFLLDDRLQISTQIYQFSRPSWPGVFPNAKLWANYTLLQHFYATAGADDFLNAWRSGHYPGGPRFSVGADVFFGGGLFFTDDDLKTLFTLGLGSAAGSVGSGK